MKRERESDEERERDKEGAREGGRDREWVIEMWKQDGV